MHLNIELTIAILALLVSLFTLWLTYLHRGTVQMTRPTTIFFGPDGNDEGEPKVYLRTLLFSTSHRGQVIESMHVRLYRAESLQTFNIWVYGNSELFRGSGLHVPKEGISYNHHFLLPKDGVTYQFLPGNYRLELYASLLNKTPIKLFTVELEVNDNQATKIGERRHGLYFDWGPESNRYHPYLKPQNLNLDFRKLLG
jgi:hypothetical protein